MSEDTLTRPQTSSLRKVSEGRVVRHIGRRNGPANGSNQIPFRWLHRSRYNSSGVTFCDWAGETTSFPREVIEAALAHGIKDKAEAAYWRSDLFDKRRDLMQAWTTVATPENLGSNVIALL